MNHWTPSELLVKWQERRSDILHNADIKYRSLHVTIELSLDALQNRDQSLDLLRAIAFLPQGVHQSDISSILTTRSSTESSTLIEPAETSPSAVLLMSKSLLRSSLLYRMGDRLTMLAPIRMYISDRYNKNIGYRDPILSSTRSHYYAMLDSEISEDCTVREHANLDRLLFFDFASFLYNWDLDIRYYTIEIMAKYLENLESLHPQTTSLWPILASEISQIPVLENNDSLVFLLGTCLRRMCWIEYRRDGLIIQCATKTCRNVSG